MGRPCYSLHAMQAGSGAQVTMATVREEVNRCQGQNTLQHFKYTLCVLFVWGGGLVSIDYDMLIMLRMLEGVGSYIYINTDT